MAVFPWGWGRIPFGVMLRGVGVRDYHWTILGKDSGKGDDVEKERTTRRPPLSGSVVCNLHHADKLGGPAGWTLICPHRTTARKFAVVPRIRSDQVLHMTILHAYAMSLRCVQLRRRMRGMSRRDPRKNDIQCHYYRVIPPFKRKYSPK